VLSVIAILVVIKLLGWNPSKVNLGPVAVEMQPGMAPSKGQAPPQNSDLENKVGDIPVPASSASVPAVTQANPVSVAQPENSNEPLAPLSISQYRWTLEIQPVQPAVRAEWKPDHDADVSVRETVGGGARSSERSQPGSELR
jgi:hypothetical protein